MKVAPVALEGRMVRRAGLEDRVQQVEALAALGQRALVALDLLVLLGDAASTVAVTLDVDLVEVLEHLPDGTLRRTFTGTLPVEAPPAHDVGSTAQVGRGVAVPIRTGDGAWGALGVHAPAQGRVFGRDEVAFLRAVAGIVGVAIARRAAEDERAAVDRRFQLLVDHIPDYAICLLDPAGTVLTWNAGATRLWGYGPDEAVGKDVAELHPSEAADARAELQTAIAAGRCEVCGWRVRRDGSRFWAHVITTALRDADGQLRGLSRVTRDMTHDKEADDTQQDLLARLQRSNRELQDFAAVASHDLQEPLRKIQMFSDRLREHIGPALDPEGQDFLDRMHRAAGRMQVLINDLLAYSRVTSKVQPLGLVDLGGIARAVRGDLEQRLAETDGRIDLEPLPTIVADPTQMRQLLQNLLANGLKFHRDGVPPVVVVRAEVVDDESGSVRLLVEDNGIGFDEKYLGRLFTIFQRLHGRETFEGTGIGLAICRKIAERHRGTITARSTPGVGSTFIVTLPSRGTPERRP